jgi:teichuronic acid biosynthesis glycosyltransferase TuaC
MALSTKRLIARLVDDFRPTLMDAHFAYPDGFAANLLAKRFGLPCVVTLRGSKDSFLFGTSREKHLLSTLNNVDGVIAVSDELCQNVAVRAGVAQEKVSTIGNGVDLARFTIEDKQASRNRLNVPLDAKVLIAVGNLVGLKGHQRLVRLMKRLQKSVPNLLLLIVGGAVPGDNTANELADLIKRDGLEKSVLLCGKVDQAELRWHYSAADLFVSATGYEGWANVLLEAMACGLPIVTTDVGGNSQVVSSPQLGKLVPFWDEELALSAIETSLRQVWQQDAIIAYAKSNQWDDRIDRMEVVFNRLVGLK